ncbi:mRNA capping enzyme, catalytic domain-containing protein [Lineolata rhizophorae]|uniref:mRNA-capping enzyme subunit alpha n=1 Tax=Lineolata rhizophorae TaxID=578093 RepID=A0A6A6NZ70_9PEZI|nr:mRNA capping enzyme, catalytic domain-containing protein [Lineolata rhizophorae]
MTSTNTAIPGIAAEDGLNKLYRREVAQLLGVKNADHFPGAQPVSFGKHHMQELREREYWVCEKTDGLRCLLYCTHDDNSNELNFLVDRKYNFHWVRDLHLPKPHGAPPPNFHDMTLLDGELVLDTYPNGDHKLKYLAFDCLAFDGQSLTMKPAHSRIGYLTQNVIAPYTKFLQANPQAVKAQPFEVQFKQMMGTHRISQLIHQIVPNLKHGNDGLIFTCSSTPYVHGSDEHIIKWKPPHENTVDFKLYLGDFPAVDPGDGEPGLVPDYDAMPQLTLMVDHGKRKGYSPYAPLFVTDEEWEAMKRANTKLHGKIIECYQDEQGRWRFKKERDGTPHFRYDKSDSNFVAVVEKIERSIADGVTEDELLAHAHEFKTAKKQSAPPPPPQGQPQPQRQPSVAQPSQPPSAHPSAIKREREEDDDAGGGVKHRRTTEERD